MKISNQDFVVTPSDVNLRLDVFLTSKLGIKRKLVQDNISEQKVTVNSNPVTKSYLLKLDDVVELKDFVTENDTLSYVPIDDLLEIAYEDEWIIVVNKPRGMLVNYGVKNEDPRIVINLVWGYLKTKDKTASIPLLINRIDQDTSGLVMLAKNEEALTKMQDLFKQRLIKKEYFGITYGKFLKLKGRIEVGLAKNSKNPRIVIPSPLGREAITIYEVIKQTEELSYCKFNIITGRTHQIRAHMKFINHPLIGDKVYGNKKYFKDGLFLHAASLEFMHPFLHKQIVINAKLPSHFDDGLKKYHLI